MLKKSLKKLLSKITIKKILFPQIFCVKPSIIKNKWVFIPLCVIFFLYNLAALSIYCIAIFFIFCYLFLSEKLKNIKKQ